MGFLQPRVDPCGPLGSSKSRFRAERKCVTFDTSLHLPSRMEKAAALQSSAVASPMRTFVDCKKACWIFPFMRGYWLECMSTGVGVSHFGDGTKLHVAPCMPSPRRLVLTTNRTRRKQSRQTKRLFHLWLRDQCNASSLVSVDDCSSKAGLGYLRP